jgi:hypothetical protein
MCKLARASVMAYDWAPLFYTAIAHDLASQRA